MINKWINMSHINIRTIHITQKWNCFFRYLESNEWRVGTVGEKIPIRNRIFPKHELLLWRFVHMKCWFCVSVVWVVIKQTCDTKMALFFFRQMASIQKEMWRIKKKMRRLGTIKARIRRIPSKFCSNYILLFCVCFFFVLFLMCVNFK